MAVIGLYDESQGEAAEGSYSVEAVHFNLWILPSEINILGILKIGGRYKYFIDVGCRLNVSEGLISSLDFSLPGAPKEDYFSDLYDEVLDDKINDLIFGTAVESKNGTIEYARDSRTVVETVQKISSFQKIDDRTEKRYRINFSSSINVDKSANGYYLRFRYKCTRPKDIVFSKGWGLAKRGYLIDFGVNDIRETVDLSKENASSHMKPINEFNGFVICPSDLIPVSISPAFKHARILEPNAWNTYLKSCGSFLKKQKYTIHYWKGKDVTFEKPFRAFMHVHKEFGWQVLLFYILGLVTPSIIGMIIKILEMS